MKKKIYSDWENLPKRHITGNITKGCLVLEGGTFVIAPSKKVTVTRLESDVEKLGDLYWMGYNDTLNVIDDLRTILIYKAIRPMSLS